MLIEPMPALQSIGAPFARHPEHDFERWYHAALDPLPADRRFDVRRAHPSQFEAVFDLVDGAFAAQRPRLLYDWIYRRNPYGLARCWIVVERATGRFVGCVPTWPWPVARGCEPQLGTLSGDVVVSPDWQRQGLHQLLLAGRMSHPLERNTMLLGWPNAKTIGAARKGGRAAHVIGPVPRWVRVLDAKRYLRERGWPGRLGAAAGAVPDALLQAWETASGLRRSHTVIEEIRRFDTAYDALTQHCMSWDGFWFPHSADFLNWRYFQHPTRQFVAFGLTRHTEPQGYGVVQIRGARALLMELVAPTQPLLRALLAHAIDVARAAACSRLTVVAPPRWPERRLLGAAGFLPVPSVLYMYAQTPSAPAAERLSNWRFLAGDMESA